jgi:hypothetical protein
MSLIRTHILMTAKQKERLSKHAETQGKSVSDLARELLDQGMDKLEEEQNLRKIRRRAALEQADRLREELLAKYGNKIMDDNPAETLQQLREERDEQLFNNLHRD